MPLLDRVGAIPPGHLIADGQKPPAFGIRPQLMQITVIVPATPFGGGLDSVIEVPAERPLEPVQCCTFPFSKLKVGLDDVPT